MHRKHVLYVSAHILYHTVPSVYSMFVQKGAQTVLVVTTRALLSICLAPHSVFGSSNIPV
jgi:hypothetical protein